MEEYIEENKLMKRLRIPSSPDDPPPKRRRELWSRIPIEFHPDKDLAGKFGELPRELKDLIREFGVPTIEECNKKIQERKFKNMRKQLMNNKEHIKHIGMITEQEERLSKAAYFIGSRFGMRQNYRFLRSMKKWIPSYDNKTTEEIVDHMVRYREASDKLWLLPYGNRNNGFDRQPSQEEQDREQEIFDRVQEIRHERGPWQIPTGELMRAIIGSRIRNNLRSPGEISDNWVNYNY